jgi:hypothetical protein
MADRPPDAEDLRRLPTGELVKQLAEETATLVRQEIALARAEVTTKSRRAGIGLGELGGAGLAALFALGALTTCFIAALDLLLPLWAAALVVAVVYGAVAAGLALTGRRQLQENVPPTPERTGKSMKENVEWAKSQRQ